MRVLRLITGLTFTRFGTNEQRELPTKHTKQHEKILQVQNTEPFVFFSYFVGTKSFANRARLAQCLTIQRLTKRKFGH
jgi:hypothetical protein